MFSLPAPQTCSHEVSTFRRWTLSSTSTSQRWPKPTCIASVARVGMDTWVLPSIWSPMTTATHCTASRRNWAPRSNPYRKQSIRPCMWPDPTIWTRTRRIGRQKIIMLASRCHHVSRYYLVSKSFWCTYQVPPSSTREYRIWYEILSLVPKVIPSHDCVMCIAVYWIYIGRFN